MASDCVRGSGGKQAGSGRKKQKKFILIRFIVDLPIRLVYGICD